MKLECEYLALCEQVLWDQLSDNLTLISCIDNIGVVSFPAVKPKFAVAAMFRHAEDSPAEDFLIEYRLVRWSTTNAEKETVAEVAGEWKSGKRRARMFLNFEVLRLPNPERIYFRIDWRHKEKRWQKGRIATIDAFLLELTPEQEARFKQQQQQLDEKIRATLQ